MAIAAVIALRCVVACVDGVTPDCSNASVCSPIEGDAGPLVETDASADARAEGGDAGSDARPNASDAADASDSG